VPPKHELQSVVDATDRQRHAFTFASITLHQSVKSGFRVPGVSLSKMRRSADHHVGSRTVVQFDTNDSAVALDVSPVQPLKGFVAVATVEA
jgi:hypothetical protein